MSMRYKSNKKQIKQQLKQAKTRTMEGLGQYVRGEIVVRAPVDTGNLRSSYDYRIDTNNDEITWGTPVEYAPHQELGTYRMAAQPHFRPAVEENMSKIRKLAQELMKL